MPNHLSYDRAELRSRLEELSSEGLVEVVIELVEHDSRLVERVFSMVAARMPIDDVSDVRDEVRHRAETIVEPIDMEERRWMGSTEWLDDLTELEERGDRFWGAGRPRVAAAIWGALTEVSMERERELNDQTAPFLDFLMRLTEKLLRCFYEFDDAERRSIVLSDLWRVWEWDARDGGSVEYDFLWDALENETTDAEKECLADRLEALLETDFPYPASPAWLLLQLVGDELTDNKFFDLCRETQLYEEHVDRLLERGRVEEALEVGVQAEKLRIVGFGKIFARCGHRKAGADLVRSKVDEVPDYMQSALDEAADRLESGEPE